MQRLFKKFKSRFVASQDGVALLWALITIAVLLGITGSMAGLIVKESQMSTGIDSSIGAYAAAESGIEHADYLINTSRYQCTTSTDISSPQQLYPETLIPIDTNLNYTLAIEGADTNTANDSLTAVPQNRSCDDYIVTSTGKSGNTTRKIEKKLDITGAEDPFVRTYYDPNPGLDSNSEHSISWLDSAPSVAPNIAVPVDSSYTQLFRVEPGILTNQFFALGFAESENDPTKTGTAADKLMFVQKASGKVGIFVGNKNESAYTSILGNEIDNPFTDSSSPYYFEISYVK